MVEGAEATVYIVGGKGGFRQDEGCVSYVVLFGVGVM
jgi:hypothetical protein